MVARKPDVRIDLDGNDDWLPKRLPSQLGIRSEIYSAPIETQRVIDITQFCTKSGGLALVVYVSLNYGSNDHRFAIELHDTHNLSGACLQDEICLLLRVSKETKDSDLLQNPRFINFARDIWGINPALLAHLICENDPPHSGAAEPTNVENRIAAHNLRDAP